MMTPDINPVELKVFLNHIYELKKGVRQMVLYTTNKRYEDFAVKRLRSQRIKFVIQRWTTSASISSSARRNALKPFA